MSRVIEDGLVFIDPENTKDKIIFNLYSWLEVIKANIIKYGEKSNEEAELLLTKTPIYKNALTTDSFMAVVLFAHESEYHWAMLTTYGELYWHKGISSDEPDGYFEWETEYRKTHNLAEESFIFEE